MLISPLYRWENQDIAMSKSSSQDTESNNLNSDLSTSLFEPFLPCVSRTQTGLTPKQQSIPSLVFWFPRAGRERKEYTCFKSHPLHCQESSAVISLCFCLGTMVREAKVLKQVEVKFCPVDRWGLASSENRNCWKLYSWRKASTAECQRQRSKFDANFLSITSFPLGCKKREKGKETESCS